MNDSGPIPSGGPDVVVVGAGISGLAVARSLLEGGRSVAVAEGRDRIGGRLHATAHGLDLGASWFWPGEDRVAALVAEAGLAVHPQHLAGDAVYDDRHQLVRLDGNPIDVPSSRFSGGADGLTRFLAEAVRAQDAASMHLTTRVHRVSCADGATVHATTPDGERTWHTRHVVIALPPALAAHSIGFEPDLPHELARLAAATPVWMGAITKVVVEYETPFWRLAGLSGSAVSHRGPLREVHDMSGPGGLPAALFGFAPTTHASGPVDRDAVVAQLSRLFGADAHEPTAVHIADWRREPLTSPPAVEAIGDHSTFGHPGFQVPAFDGRLLWASTETGPVAPGHIEGALAAAERTVASILHHFDRTESTA